MFLLVIFQHSHLFRWNKIFLQPLVFVNFSWGWNRLRTDKHAWNWHCSILKKHSFQKCSRCSSLICNVLTTLPRNRRPSSMDEVFDAPMSQRRTPLQLQVTLADHEMFWRPSQHTLVLRSMATVRSLKIWKRTTTNLWELFPQLIKQFCLVSWCQTAVPWNLNGSKIKNPSLIA